jgi:hypothetical protein
MHVLGDYPPPEPAHPFDAGQSQRKTSFSWHSKAQSNIKRRKEEEEETHQAPSQAARTGRREIKRVQL